MKVPNPTKVFVTSDLHLDRDEIRKEQIISGWKERVSENDIIFVLGDVCDNFKKCKHVFNNLPGEVFLVKGNHDHFSNGHIFDMGVTQYETDAILLYVSHPYRTFRIILSHKPFPMRRIRNMPKPINIVVHGHNHRQRKLVRKVNNTFYFNVITDKWDYWPLSIDEIIRIINGEKVLINGKHLINIT